ncbi:lanthionine synthetase LanC family protein [Tenacibaculum sp. TC6]|uniref:lanthionine synthetase LanC family protein n=1 Tax=Tenacibaculum sp. TC6 TaxID=3423223 RepID=UPI003D35C08B
MINKIDKRIYDIEKVLRKLRNKFDSISLKNGSLGLSLFYYYYYLYTKKDKYLNEVSYYLEKSLAYLESGKIEDFSMFDLIELGEYVCFLHKKECIDEHDALKIIKEIEPFILNLLDDKIEEEDLGSLKGVLRVGNYLIDLRETFKLNNEFYLISIVKFIDQLSIHKNAESIFWRFPMRNKENPIVELGFVHGMSGIIYFLSRMVENQLEKEKCAMMIKKSTSFVLSFKQDEPNTLFPFADVKQKRSQKSYQCLGYGDIGIGYTFLHLGKYVDKAYFKIGEGIIDNASNFRDDEGVFIKDAELVYGASGLFVFFDKFKELSNKYEKAADYWLNRIINFNYHESDWAGYKTYINGFDETIQLSFQHGLIGIGLALINTQLTFESHDYLCFLNYKDL